MGDIYRVRTIWTGAPLVGPTVSTFYLGGGSLGFLSDLHAFWGAVGNRVPAGITWSTSNTGDVLEDTTGAITGTWTDGTNSTISSSGTGPFAAGVGARMVMSTDGIRNKRRVKGSIYLVPLTTACYQSDGTIDSAVLTALQTAASALLTGLQPEWKVYSRPHKGTNDGQQQKVLSVTVPDKISWLRSRRT